MVEQCQEDGGISQAWIVDPKVYPGMSAEKIYHVIHHFKYEKNECWRYYILF